MRFFVGFFLGFAALVSGNVFAETCPETIRYANGSYLKRGSTYYYSNGSYLARNEDLYYPNGSYLKRSDTVYYPNGNPIQRNQNLYYPSGSTLRRGSDYFYANGVAMSRSGSFYYRNGSVARRNGILYRENGTQTVFPISLSETIGDYGRLFAEVRKDSEQLDVSFQNLIIDSSLVSVDALWDGTQFGQFEMLLNTGVLGENVFVLQQGTTITCSLMGSVPENSFTLYGKAATVKVQTNPGYDAAKVRQYLTDALNSITP